MWKNAKWIGLPREEIEAKRIYSGDMTGRFAYFRKKFTAVKGSVYHTDGTEGDILTNRDIRLERVAGQQFLSAAGYDYREYGSCD